MQKQFLIRHRATFPSSDASVYRARDAVLAQLVEVSETEDARRHSREPVLSLFLSRQFSVFALARCVGAARAAVVYTRCCRGYWTSLVCRRAALPAGSIVSESFPCPLACQYAWKSLFNRYARPRCSVLSSSYTVGVPLRRGNRYALATSAVYARGPLAVIGWPKSTVSSKYCRPRGSARVSTFLTSRIRRRVVSSHAGSFDPNLGSQDETFVENGSAEPWNTSSDLRWLSNEKDRERGTDFSEVREKGPDCVAGEGVRSEREGARWLAKYSRHVCNRRLRPSTPLGWSHLQKGSMLQSLRLTIF